MTNATCVKAFTQVTEVALVYIKIGGVVKGALAYRNCRVQRLRTEAGGRTVINAQRSVDASGKPVDTAQQLDKIKEANRYKIDDCLPASATDDPIQLTVEYRRSADTPSLGLLDVSDEQWAQLRVHTATEDELRGVPESWDERRFPCPNAQAIQKQDTCGVPLRIPMPCTSLCAKRHSWLSGGCPL